MEEMLKHPRLMRRGNTFWHRAAIPADIKTTYPTAEETFTLRTKDPREALMAVRKAAADVDERSAAHRRQLALGAAPPLMELTKGQLEAIEDIDGFYNPVRRHSALDYQSPV